MRSISYFHESLSRFPLHKSLSTTFSIILSALPDELGFDVKPATNTNFGLSEVVQVKLEAPYSSGCYSNWTQTNYTDLPGMSYLISHVYVNSRY